MHVCFLTNHFFVVLQQCENRKCLNLCSTSFRRVINVKSRCKCSWHIHFLPYGLFFACCMYNQPQHISMTRWHIAPIADRILAAVSPIHSLLYLVANLTFSCYFRREVVRERKEVLLTCNCLSFVQLRSFILSFPFLNKLYCYIVKL